MPPPAVNTKLPAILSHRHSTTVSLETYHLYSSNVLFVSKNCSFESTIPFCVAPIYSNRSSGGLIKRGEVFFYITGKWQGSKTRLRIATLGSNMLTKFQDNFQRLLFGLS